MMHGGMLEADDEKQSIPFMLAPEREHSQGRIFDIHRLAALARRETVELFRDPVRLVTSFIVTPFLLIVFGFGISTDIEKITFSTLDCDQKPWGGNTWSTMPGPASSARPPPSTRRPGSTKDSRRASSSSSWSCHRVRGGHKARQVPHGGHLDRRNHAVSGGDHQELRGRGAPVLPHGPGRVHGFPRIIPNRRRGAQILVQPHGAQRFSIVPGLMAVVLMLVPSMLTAIGVVREKELGSITNFYSSPMTRLEFLWASRSPTSC